MVIRETILRNLLEVIAHKIFGHASAHAAIKNDMTFYTHDGYIWDHFVSSINLQANDIFCQYVAAGHYNTFSNLSDFNNLNNNFIIDNQFNDVGNYVNFNFQNYSFEFSLYLAGSVDLDSSLTNQEIQLLSNGPNVGGTLLVNGSYNVPILLTFV